MTTEKDKARVCATCGKLENEFCSNSFHLSNDKTAEEIHDRYCAGVPYQLGLREASINAMKAYSAQQLKEYKEKLREAIRIIEKLQNSWISAEHYWGSETNEITDTFLDATKILIAEGPKQGQDQQPPEQEP